MKLVKRGGIQVSLLNGIEVVTGQEPLKAIITIFHGDICVAKRVHHLSGTFKYKKIVAAVDLFGR